jgi:hypothetical protein
MYAFLWVSMRMHVYMRECRPSQRYPSEETANLGEVPLISSLDFLYPCQHKIEEDDLADADVLAKVWVSSKWHQHQILRNFL